MSGHHTVYMVLVILGHGLCADTQKASHLEEGPAVEHDAVFLKEDGQPKDEVKRQSAPNFLATSMAVGKAALQQGVKQTLSGGAEFVSSSHNHEDGKSNTNAKTILGSLSGELASKYVGKLSIVPKRFQGGFAHISQIMGDKFMEGTLEVIRSKEAAESANSLKEKIGLRNVVGSSGNSHVYSAVPSDDFPPTA